MLPTPDLSHLSRSDYVRDVYEPAEDTFALLDALEADADKLRDARPRSGSGCVTSFLARILGPDSAAYVATDINPYASKATAATGRQNGLFIDAVLTSLCTSLLPRLASAVDILLFNPPYVPTTDSEQLQATADASLAGAWAGGSDGMAVTDHLLANVSTLLAPHGVFYLVAVAENRPRDILQRMQAEYNLAGEVVLKRRAGGELLFILKICKSSTH